MNTIPSEYLNQIVTGDARELSKRIPDKSVRLAFADPPYWVGFDYGNKTDAEMDFIEPEWLVNEMKRIAQVSIITSGNGNQYKYPIPDWTMAWRKGNSMKRYAWGFCHWEPLLAYGKPNIPQSKLRPDMFDAPIIVEKHSHECPKPLSLMVQLIETFTEPDDLVIDFFVGSGTTAKAAKMLGRNYIAFEIDSNTADRARQRVYDTQSPLFQITPEQIPMEFAE